MPRRRCVSSTVVDVAHSRRVTSSLCPAGVVDVANSSRVLLSSCPVVDVALAHSRRVTSSSCPAGVVDVAVVSCRSRVPSLTWQWHIAVVSCRCCWWCPVVVVARSCHVNEVNLLINNNRTLTRKTYQEKDGAAAAPSRHATSSLLHVVGGPWLLCVGGGLVVVPIHVV